MALGGTINRNQYTPGDPYGANQAAQRRRDSENEYWRKYGLQGDLYQQQNTNEAQGIYNQNQVAQALESLSQLGYSLGSDTYNQALTNLRVGGDVLQQKTANVRYMQNLREALASLGYTRTRERNNLQEEIARIRQQQARDWEPGVGARMARLLGYPS